MRYRRFAFLLFLCLFSPLAAAPPVLEATFDAAAPLTGLGFAATTGPWDPAGVEIGSATAAVSDSPCDPPVLGQNSAFVDTGPSGLRGTSQGLHLADANCGDSRVTLEPVNAQSTSTSDYWIDFSFKLNAAASGQADSLGRVELFDDNNNQVTKIWLGLYAAAGQSPQFRYRYFIDPAVCGGCGLDDVSVDAFTLGEATLSDEWRALIRIDPINGTQTHRLWRNDSAIDKQDQGVAAFGTAHGLFQTQNSALDRMLVRTDYSRLSDLHVDEIRITENLPQNFPVDLTAQTAAGGITLDWVNLSGGETHFVVERRVGEGGWVEIGSAGSGSVSYVDGTASGNEPHVYRVAAVFVDGSRSPWTLEAKSIPVYQNRPLYGWLNVGDYVNDPVFHAANCTTASDLRHPIQCAINDLGIDQNGNASSAGPHVLYFPNDTYDVDQTLYMENKLGVQLVGETPGLVRIRWDSSFTGTGPGDVAVLFHFEGGRDVTFRNIVWDGGCADPAGDPQSCFVVAFDESYCGRTGNAERTAECDSLPWPEDGSLGTGDVATAHFDSEFVNAHIGLRIGHFEVQDSEVTVRRARFTNNFIGASIEDQNALNEWFWDCLFEDNVVGITVYPGFVWKYEGDTGWLPGTCDEPTEAACFWDADCPSSVTCRKGYCDVSGDPCTSSTGCAGENCLPVMRRGGDFQIFRGRFRNNLSADVWHTSGGHYIVKDSWSSGSGRFFYGLGSTGSTTSAILANNVVDGFDPLNKYDRRAVDNGNTGTVMLLDNQFYTLDPTKPPVYSATFRPTDVFALNNGFNFDPATHDPYATGATTEAKFRTFDDYEVDCDPCTVTIPEMPAVTEPLDGRPIYTVLGRDDAAIQATIDVALADPGPLPPIVHIPSLPGIPSQPNYYDLEHTLTVPAGSALDIVGDGGFTVLQWNGAGNDPILRIDGNQSNVTVRDLQLRQGGLIVDNMDQDDSAAFLSQVRTSNAGDAGVVLDGLDETRVDLVDLIVWSSRDDRPIGVVVKAGDEPDDPPANPGTAVWTGSMNTNEIDFDVINGPAGIQFLVTTTYMEHSHHYLRARGQGPPGRVEVHGSNMSTEVVPDDPPDLGAGVATITIEDFPGNVSITESEMFIQNFFVDCCPGNSEGDCCLQIDRGVKIAQSGSEATTIQAIGNRHQKRDIDLEPDGTPETLADADVSSTADYLRVSGKLSARSGFPSEPMSDFRLQNGTLSYDLDESQVGALLGVHLDPAFELLRTIPAPGFYDESPSESYRINFDRVFFWSPSRYGLVLTGGPSCDSDADCDDGQDCTTNRCDMDDLPNGVPGQCLPAVENCGPGRTCGAFGQCADICFDDNECDDGVSCTQDRCLFELGQPGTPGVCRNFDGACDDDNDGRPNADDCARQDPSVWATPSPARDLQLSAPDAGILSWTAPIDPGGITPLYDVTRDDAPEFPAPACPSSGGAATSAVDTAPPAPGQVFLYLIRAYNSCGENMGSDSEDTPRTAPPCP